MKRKTKPLTITSVIARCIKRGECRIWTGALSRNGYPYLHDPEKYARHLEAGSGGTCRSGRRVVWKLKHRQEARGTVIMTCFNKLCLNPDHMQEASRSVVMLRAEGLHSAPRVISRTVNRLKPAKLDWAKAQAIRAALAPYPGKRNDKRAAVMKELAAFYGVGVTCINDVRKGKRWASAPAVPMSSAWTFAANDARQAA